MQGPPATSRLGVGCTDDGPRGWLKPEAIESAKGGTCLLKLKPQAAFRHLFCALPARGAGDTGGLRHRPSHREPLGWLQRGDHSTERVHFTSNVSTGLQGHL